MIVRSCRQFIAGESSAKLRHSLSADYCATVLRSSARTLTCPAHVAWRILWFHAEWRKPGDGCSPMRKPPS